jgi:hypothetical protein
MSLISSARLKITDSDYYLLRDLRSRVERDVALIVSDSGSIPLIDDERQELSWVTLLA